MKKLISYSALAVFIGANLGSVALADTASTTGGLKIKSDDGNFEAAVGGRIHFDGALVSEDNGSSLKLSDSKKASGFYFRRVFLSLVGRAYGWDYHIDEDFVGGGGGAAGFNDVWMAHDVFSKYDHGYIGQHKPWRSLDEMASNNNLPLMERNILSANGIFGGRDFTEGLYYRYAQNGIWAGTSFYSDGKAGQSTGPSYGANVRFAYAPIMEKTEWLHAGLSYSFDNAGASDYVAASGTTAATFDGYGKIAPGYSTWYAKNGKGVTLTSSSFNVASGNDINASTGTLELAGAFGPFFGQAEYGATHEWASVGETATVDAYSVTAAYALTGETRPYDASNATYGGIKPKSVDGAWEVAVRYDYGKNKSYDTSGCGLAKSNVTKCDVSSITAGVNYYVNPNVRFMLNYVHGEADAGNAGKDSPDAVMGRAQFVF